MMINDFRRWKGEILKARRPVSGQVLMALLLGLSGVLSVVVLVLLLLMFG